MADAVSLGERIKERGRALGFDAVGIARADALDTDHARYERFIERGFHGEMGFVARDAIVRKRADDAGILAGARSVICVASAYQRKPEDEAADPAFSRRIARYARGRDYHNGLRKKLRQLAAFVRTLGDGVEARPLSDDAPILERAWAARAGLGFIGKNGMLIVPGLGSFVLLGEVVTTLEIDAGEPMAERCGTCTRCIDACPTRAIVEPFVLDARKCISYLTIESRSAIPVTLRAGVGEHLFGCDDCQTVCPFTRGNKSSPASSRYEPLERWSRTELVDLLSIESDSPRWRELSEGTPLHRATADGLARNAAIVLGNARDDAARGPLSRAAREHPSEMVREAARWALRGLRSEAETSEKFGELEGRSPSNDEDLGKQ
ncbi:MAG TPA: tRNA epoxyqueuosine(34) reductase QueG [Polyangiaceae bacterium]|nr:tRNA epoxyqueuosine(34) reductase QueG [Polyangiaceae bacterium]